MEHKRGDTFDYRVAIPASYADGYFVAWTTLSQIRQAKSGALVATLTTSWLDGATTRDLRLLAIDTSGWPLGALEFDVQLTRISDGYVLSTNTIAVDLVPDVTRP